MSLSVGSTDEKEHPTSGDGQESSTHELSRAGLIERGTSEGLQGQARWLPQRWSQGVPKNAGWKPLYRCTCGMSNARGNGAIHRQRAGFGSPSPPLGILLDVKATHGNPPRRPANGNGTSFDEMAI